jgi:hypothetical protein
MNSYYYSPGPRPVWKLQNIGKKNVGHRCSTHILFDCDAGHLRLGLGYPSPAWEIAIDAPPHGAFSNPKTGCKQLNCSEEEHRGHYEEWMRRYRAHLAHLESALSCVVWSLSIAFYVKS